MALRVPLRRYQQRLLAAADSTAARADHVLHLCAPPGSGKTLLGLELARRRGRAVVVFAPTTAIVGQWRDEVGLFLPAGASSGPLVSTDPSRVAPVTVLTYQALATPRAASAHLLAAAQAAWRDELVLADRVADAAAADHRIATMAAANPDAHARELRRRATSLRRQALRHALEPTAVAGWLHDHARALVDRLVAAGVGTVVLDECHHLLDYWAIVLGHLVDRLDDPLVIGLTATLPEPAEGSRQADTYAALLGPVDLEVPVPAVVREGELAPYRDLLACVEPTPREARWLADVQGLFGAAVVEATTDPAFVHWLVATTLGPALEDEERWADWLLEEPVLAVAALRVARERGLVLPTALPLPVEADAPPHLDDWCAVLERWALDVLALSPDPADAERLARLRAALAPFGLALTERGLRQGRSPGDLVLALSDAKHAMAARILAAEAADLGERLRALVVVDFERAGTAVAALDAALAADAGSARRLHAHLAQDEHAAVTAPLLMTARTLRAGAQGAEELRDWLNLEAPRRGYDCWWTLRGTDQRHVLDLVGTGTDARPAAWVPLVTAAFEAGLVRCLVGTRALLGEGWNSRRCNTLLDLSGAATRTASRQLRGRALRLDPAWPGKVAHCWDVVCVAPGYERGDTDLARFRRRHAHLWGLEPGSDTGVAAIVRGSAHVDPELTAQLATGPWQQADFAAATGRSLAAVGTREETRRRVGGGDPVRGCGRDRRARGRLPSRRPRARAGRRGRCGRRRDPRPVVAGRRAVGGRRGRGRAGRRGRARLAGRGCRGRGRGGPHRMARPAPRRPRRARTGRPHGGLRRDRPRRPRRPDLDLRRPDPRSRPAGGARDRGERRGGGAGARGGTRGAQRAMGAGGPPSAGAAGGAALPRPPPARRGCAPRRRWAGRTPARARGRAGRGRVAARAGRAGRQPRTRGGLRPGADGRAGRGATGRDPHPRGPARAAGRPRASAAHASRPRLRALALASRAAAAGSYLASFLLSGLVEVAVAALIGQRRALVLSPGTVALRRHREGWVDGLALRDARVRVLPDDPEAGSPDAVVVDDPAALRRHVAAELAAIALPVFASVRALAPFGAVGMAGNFADSAAWAGVEHAGERGVDAAWAEVDALLDELRLAGLAFRARPRLDCAVWEGTRRSFVIKSACCLYFRTYEGTPDRSGEGYCTSCPLRCDTWRRERLAQWLAEGARG